MPRGNPELGQVAITTHRLQTRIDGDLATGTRAATELLGVKNDG